MSSLRPLTQRGIQPRFKPQQIPKPVSAQGGRHYRNPIQFYFLSLVNIFLVPTPIQGWGIIPEIIPHLCLSPQTSSKHPPPSSSLSANDFAFSCHGENRCVLKITSIHSHPHVYLLHYIQPMCSAILPATADGLSCATEARLSVSGLDPPYLTFLAH